MSEVSVASHSCALRQLVEAILTHLIAASFQDVRPAHGFVFVRVSTPRPWPGKSERNSYVSMTDLSPQVEGTAGPFSSAVAA